MSDLGLEPALQPAVAPIEQPASKIPIWVLLVAVLVMLAMAAATLFIVMREADKRTYPARWDPRIAPYVQVVQQHRGLFFLHPVTVRFLPQAEFEKSIAADKKELSTEDRTEIDQFTGLMRAVGLLEGDVDLFDSVNDFTAGGTLAYYSFEDERITIRGEKMTPAIRSTLVHELTHVLQDQHFNIGDKMKKLRKESEDGASTSESTMLDAVVEGDAERVRSLYRDALKPKQRKALDAGSKNDVAVARKRIKNVPKVIVTMMTSPYTLGAGLVQTVAANGGNPKVDMLFRDLPTDETSLLDPFQALSGDKAKNVKAPKLEGGEKKFDSGEFGTVTWYLMLAERLPLMDALETAEGWGGDEYVGFERRGVSCARMAYAGKTPRDARRMFSALRRWGAATPGSTTKVRRAGDRVRFETCDPGKATRLGKDASQDAVRLVLTRTSLALGMRRSGVPTKMARCVAEQLVATYPVSKLVDPKFGVGNPAVKVRIQQLAAVCR
jgi:hypothetical protein